MSCAGRSKEGEKDKPKGQNEVILSRKDFFRQGIFSLGETLLKVSGTALNVYVSPGLPPSDFDPDKEPVADENMIAKADNQHCLAKGCGCFSCVERCENEAIKLIPGTGISIDEALCTGCGTCEYICPVEPKAVVLISRQQ
jgi:ferredoxin